MEKQRAAIAHWQTGIKKIKSMGSALRIMKSLTKKHTEEEETKPEIIIDGKTYKRPILKTFTLPSEQAVFEITNRYTIKEILGHGAYGMVWIIF